MKFLLKLFVCYLCVSIFFGCAGEDPKKARAKQLFREMGEIAEKSRQEFIKDETISRIKSINDLIEGFPRTKKEIQESSKFVINKFTESIKADRQVIEKLEELLELGIVEDQAKCIKSRVKVQNSYILRAEQVLSQYEIFFDESIREKETLKARMAEAREKSKVIESKATELENQKMVLCEGIF